MNKPKVKLLGQDGNAFFIIGACSRVMRKAGWTKEQQDAVIAELMEGDYTHLLATAMKHFEVV